MTPTLSGKWAWIWNWRRCDGGDPAKVAARLREAGCRGALVKAHDGPRWFDQGRPWREIAAALKAQGLLVAGWAYLYGRDPAAETRLVGETVSYGRADLFVLDVEAEFEGRPQAAEELCRRAREAVGPNFPLYYSSFAIGRYHRSFPYQVFARYCQGTAPQIYWNAFRWPVQQAVRWTYEDYAALGEAPQRVFPVAGLYTEREVPYPTRDDVKVFAEEAARRGSPGLSFWSYEHMSDEMWAAVSALGGQKQEVEMSSQEYQQLSNAHAALADRVGRLEAQVAALEKGPAPKKAPSPPRRPSPARYHTVGPEGARGLWGVAEHLGVPTSKIPGWIAKVKELNGFTAENPIIHQGDRLRIP